MRLQEIVKCPKYEMSTNDTWEKVAKELKNRNIPVFSTFLNKTFQSKLQT
jgi:L-rhamnose mutarotase